MASSTGTESSLDEARITRVARRWCTELGLDPDEQIIWLSGEASQQNKDVKFATLTGPRAEIFEDRVRELLVLQRILEKEP